MAYPGGKSGSGVYQTIINQFPPHDTYIEPFAGQGGILRRKRPASRNIAVDLDPELEAFWCRRPDVEWVNACGIGYLEAFGFKGRELVYCDPPYLKSTRRSQRDIYQFEMDYGDHLRFLVAVAQLPAMVVVSGYDSEVYNQVLDGWRSVTFQAATRGRPAMEKLWCNFPAPTALHDYSHIGGDYRERERIKRKAGRWVARFDGLPELERKAIMSRLADFTR